MTKFIKFEEMPVWQDSQDFAVDIYKATEKFPKEELYSLVNQIRRSSSSISANIAEGFGRSTKKDRLRFYHIALGSLLETKNFIYLAGRLGYIDKAGLEALIDKSDKILDQIHAIRRYLSNNE